MQPNALYIITSAHYSPLHARVTLYSSSSRENASYVLALAGRVPGGLGCWRVASSCRCARVIVLLCRPGVGLVGRRGWTAATAPGAVSLPPAVHLASHAQTVRALVPRWDLKAKRMEEREFSGGWLRVHEV